MQAGYFNPEVQKENEFTWGLAAASNNEAETLAMYQSLIILKEKGMSQIQ